jgi:hypothetical protein
VVTRDEGERINRAVYNLARAKTFDLYREATRRGVINGGQAEALMALWDERHPYEPLTTDP